VTIDPLSIINTCGLLLTGMFTKKVHSKVVGIDSAVNGVDTSRPGVQSLKENVQELVDSQRHEASVRSTDPV
jgi:hypothetical protein